MLKKDVNGQKFIFGIPIGQVITWLFLIAIAAYTLLSELQGSSINLTENIDDITKVLTRTSRQVEKNTERLAVVENGVNTMKAEYASEIKHMNQNIKAMGDDIRDIKNYILNSGSGK